MAAQTASDQAGITRNTVDMQRAEAANQDAAQRATQAGPAYDTAIRDLQSFRPMGSDELAGLEKQQATNATNATFRPLVADTLRSFQRSGTAAGPVLANIGKTQYDALRDSLMKSRIDAITGMDAINQSRRQGLEQSAANRYSLATPQFQYPGINTATGSNTMANLVAQRAQQAGTAPAFGAGGVNTAAGQRQTAGANVAGAVPGQLNTAADVGKDIGSMLSNKDLVSNAQELFDPAARIGSTRNWEQELPNSPLSQYYNPPASDHSSLCYRLGQVMATSAAGGYGTYNPTAIDPFPIESVLAKIVGENNPAEAANMLDTYQVQTRPVRVTTTMQWGSNTTSPSNIVAAVV